VSDTDHPNVLFIMADDLGWMDTSHYGSEFFETPNIDRLAEESMTFTEAYAASPLCSPTRSSVLTGQYPARTGITAPQCHLPEERFEQEPVDNVSEDTKVVPSKAVTRLSTEYETLAEVFSNAGYATGHFGKWHLGPEPYAPENHGFDRDIPNTNAPGPAGGYHAPWSFWPEYDNPGENIEDAMADVATDFIAEHADGDEPFFCNYWNFSVHTPIDGDIDLVEKYVRKMDPEDPQHHPVYGAMVEKMDTAVGSLLDELEAQGIRDDTLVVFFSDNGGVNWAAGGGEMDVTDNSPLRGGKASIYEGGTREPLLVSWPGEIEPGSETDALVSSVDFYPTFLELLDIERASEEPLDGESFADVLRGGDGSRTDIFCHFPHDVGVHPQETPAASIRDGEWKLIRFFHAGPEFDHRYELYNLAEDIGERQNLAHSHPEKVESLDAKLEDYLDDTDAYRPEPNPDYTSD
jgi:arylsulfatase A-like enzyme